MIGSKAKHFLKRRHENVKILNYWFFIDIINPIWVYPSVLYVFPLVSFVFSFTFSPWVSWRRLWVFLLFSLCNCWKLHADILIKSECFCLSFLKKYISGELTRGLKLLFMAGSACWSVTKSDCEFLSSFGHFYCFSFFLCLGQELDWLSSTLECFHPVQTNLR